MNLVIDRLSYWFRPAAFGAVLAISVGGCNNHGSDVAAVTADAGVPAVTVAYGELDYRSGVFYSGGKPFSGVAKVAYPDGTPAKEIPLNEGRYHGVVREWAENGTQVVETHFHLGKRHGKNTYWFPDGRLQKEQVYEHDKVVSETKHY